MWLELFATEVLGPFALRCAFVAVALAAGLASLAVCVVAFKDLRRDARGQG